MNEWVRAMANDIKQWKEVFVKEMTELEEAKREVEEQNKKLEKSFPASLIEGDNKIHNQLEERPERIRELEMETERLQMEETDGNVMPKEC